MSVQLSTQGAIIKTAYEAEANAYTDAKNTKLTGIDAGANVTDATTVAAAGAVMDSDFSAGEGFMRKTGVGAYEVIKTNMNASVAPTVNEDSADGYAVGSRWFDTTADKEYVCLAATVGAAVWIETTQSGGGVTTWVGLTDTYGSITANKLVMGNSGGYALEFSATNEADYFLRTGARAMAGTLSMNDYWIIGITSLVGSGGGSISIGGGLGMNSKSIDDIGALILNNATELTIATGAVTATQSYHSIDTEADAATDDLDTISGGTAGQILTIKAIDSARTVVAKNATGNLQLTADMSLDNANDTLTMIYDGTNWLETGRANNGA